MRERWGGKGAIKIKIKPEPRSKTEVEVFPSPVLPPPSPQGISQNKKNADLGKSSSSCALCFGVLYLRQVYVELSKIVLERKLICS